MTRRPWLAVGLVVAGTALLALAFWFDWWPPLRGGFGWRWPRVDPDGATLRRLMPALAVLPLYGAGLWFLRRRAGAYVAWCLLGAVAIPVVLLSVQDDPFFLLVGRTITSGTTGAYTLGTMLRDPWAALRDWPAWMVRAQKISSHMATSPPAWPLLYAWLGDLLDHLPALARWLAAPLRHLQCHHVLWMRLSDGQVAGAWLGIAAPLWAALSVLPLYDVARRLEGGALARRALAWWALIPSVALFTGTLTAPYPLLSNVTLWLLARGLERRRAPWLVAAGALTAASVLVSFSLLPLGLAWALWVGLQAAAGEGTTRQKARAWATVAAWCGLGAGAVYLFYSLLAGHTPWDLFRAGMAFHLGHIERPYGPWLVLHPWDYLLFLGPPLLILSLVSLRHWRRSAAARLSLATALTLLALVLSGTGRGETGRIWLFFMPLSLLGAAEAMGALRPSQRVALAVAQAAWLVTLAAVLRPVGHALTPRPCYAAPTASAPLRLTSGTRFGEDLELLGWGASQEDGLLWLTLHWRATRRIEEAYRFSALLVSPQGALPQATDWDPLGGRYPTTCWAGTGEIVDRVALPLGESPPSGEWWLSLSAYVLDEEEQPRRLTVTLPSGESDTQTGLGPIWVR